MTPKAEEDSKPRMTPIARITDCHSTVLLAFTFSARSRENIDFQVCAPNSHSCLFFPKGTTPNAFGIGRTGCKPIFHSDEMHASFLVGAKQVRHRLQYENSAR